MPYLKIRIDRERQRHGKWMLTGSQQFQLMANVSESLAGRIVLLELLPFSLLETAGVQGESLSVLVCRIPERRELPGGNVALPRHEFPGWLQGKLGGDG